MNDSLLYFSYLKHQNKWEYAVYLNVCQAACLFFPPVHDVTNALKTEVLSHLAILPN